MSLKDKQAVFFVFISKIKILDGSMSFSLVNNYSKIISFFSNMLMPLSKWFSNREKHNRRQSFINIQADKYLVEINASHWNRIISKSLNHMCWIGPDLNVNQVLLYPLGALQSTLQFFSACSQLDLRR